MLCYCTELSHERFYRRNYEELQTITGNAYKATDNDQLKA